MGVVGSPVWGRRWHGLVALVVGFGLVVQLVLVIWFPIAGTPEFVGTRVLRFLSFFTIQSNLLVLATALSLARDPDRDGRWWRVARLDAVVAITVTGVVHFVALRPLQDLAGWDAVADVLLHVASPLLVITGWLIFGPRPRVSWCDVRWSAVWPLAWLAYTMIHGELSGWYPYPFVDPSGLGYGRVLINALVVTVIFLSLASAARWADSRLRPAPAR